MLGSHTSGVTRESFSTGFNQVLSTGKATADGIGALWANQTVENVIQGAGKTGLMFRPGERSAYSNVGVGILGAAVASYYNEITRQDLTWSQFATQELLEPLDMTHSFFGCVPDSLIPVVSVPGGENWADLVIGEGYNPAAGMWVGYFVLVDMHNDRTDKFQSSANDLAKYLYGIWLQPSPSLVTPFDRRKALQPVHTLQDGKQQVGPGWEILLQSFSTNANASNLGTNKTYSIYGKSGGGGGWRSWIDVVPNLGYGLVVLTQTADIDGYDSLFPASLYTSAHEILSQALQKPSPSRSMGNTLAHTEAVGIPASLRTK